MRGCRRNLVTLVSPVHRFLSRWLSDWFTVVNGMALISADKGIKKKLKILGFLERDRAQLTLGIYLNP